MRKQFAGALIIVAVFSFAATAQNSTKTVSMPMITGPVTGPGPMYPALTQNSLTGQQAVLPKGTDLSDFDYETNEYFVSGTAAGKAYMTRILIHTPKNAKKFSGVVVAESIHASGIAWMFFDTRVYMMNRGHAHVEIDAQKTPLENSVIAFNKDRYKSLNIPDAAQVNDIIAQVGAAIKSKTGPLAELPVRKSVLMGTSNTSAVLRSYLPTHMSTRMPNGSAIFDGFYATSTGGANQIQKIDVPLVHLATLTEVNAEAANGNRYRRSDGDEPGNQYRLYEIAGMPHNESRDNPTYSPNPCEKPINTIPVGALMGMGLHHLIQWVDKGIVPPRADRIIVDGDKSNGGSLFALDESGNVQGGVRNTYVDVPIAKYGVPNIAQPKPGSRVDFYCNIAGWQEMLPDEKLKALYKDQKEYQKKVDARLKQLVRDGWFLPEYTKETLDDAARAGMPPLNDLPQPYRTTRDWGKPPGGVPWAAVTAVEVGNDGSVYVIHRCSGNSCAGRSEPPILKFDKSGNLLKSWGEGMFVFPHGATIDADGTLGVTDAQIKDGKGYQVFKFSPDGKLLMTLGKAGVASAEPGLFDEPTDVLVNRNGEIFITEGHSGGTKGNNRIQKFSKDGRFIKAWGKEGAGHGEFNNPHTIAMDFRGRLFIGDRSNNRIEIFDQDGKYLDTWTQWGRPSGIFIAKDDTMYVADSESWGPDQPGWKKGIRIGSAKDGAVKYFIEDMESTTIDHSGAESVGVDAEGNIYGGVVRRQMLERHVKKFDR